MLFQGKKINCIITYKNKNYSFDLEKHKTVNEKNKKNLRAGKNDPPKGKPFCDKSTYQHPAKKQGKKKTISNDAFLKKKKIKSKIKKKTPKKKRRIKFKRRRRK